VSGPRALTVSIVIPALNEAKNLPALLESIRSQDFQDYEIIVADAGSTDGTREIAEGSGARVVEGGMPAAGRNKGARSALGAFLFFFDADVMLPAGFLSRAVQEMEEKYLDLATCRLIPDSSLRTDRLLHSFANLYIALSQYGPTPHAPGLCIMISKRLFDRVGGFNEEMRNNEDHDLVARAARFRPLFVLSDLHVIVSIRRLEKEGRLGLIRKYMLSELTNLTKGLIPESLFEYEFANYRNVEPRRFDENLKRFERRLDGLKERYRRTLFSHGRGPGDAGRLKAMRRRLRREWKRFVIMLRRGRGMRRLRQT
jgi:glycosyltransferase involved in cell wall biosynthesis